MFDDGEELWTSIYWPHMQRNTSPYIYESQLYFDLALSPDQTDSQVDASLQNQNLRTDLRRVAKRIRKSQKAVNFTHIIG